MTYYIKEIIKSIISGFVYHSGLWHIFIKIFRKKGILALAYHNFNTYMHAGSIFITNYVDNFEKQLFFLKKYFRFVNLDKFNLEEHNDNLYLLLTFDDGYKDNFDIAFPRLAQYGIPAIFFVTTDYVSSTKLLWYDELRYLTEVGSLSRKKVTRILKRINRGELSPKDISMPNNVEWPEKRIMMDWEEIKSISQLPLFAVGSHTKTHSPLYHLDVIEQEIEIGESIRAIENETGHEVIFFSYPNGSFTKETPLLLQKAGIKYAFTLIPGVNYPSQDRLKLKKIGINPSDSIPVLVMKILFYNIFASFLASWLIRNELLCFLV